jgi:hypothetical protein
VVKVFRYVLEELTEPQLMEIDRREPVPNCSVTRYEAGPDGGLQLAEAGAVGHLTRAGRPVVEEPDVHRP